MDDTTGFLETRYLVGGEYYGPIWGREVAARNIKGIRINTSSYLKDGLQLNDAGVDNDFNDLVVIPHRGTLIANGTINPSPVPERPLTTVDGGGGGYSILGNNWFWKRDVSTIPPYPGNQYYAGTILSNTGISHIKGPTAWLLFSLL